MTQLRSVTRHMGSHSVTFYPTQVNAPRLHPSQTCWYQIYRPFKGGGLSKPRPRVQRATGPLLLRDSPEPAMPEPMTQRSQSSTLTTRLSRVYEVQPTWCFWFYFDLILLFILALCFVGHRPESIRLSGSFLRASCCPTPTTVAIRHAGGCGEQWLCGGAGGASTSVRQRTAPFVQSYPAVFHRRS